MDDGGRGERPDRGPFSVGTHDGSPRGKKDRQGVVGRG